MKNEDSRFYKVSELLPDALNRLYETVKERKIKELLEKIKNEKFKENERI